jgi:O-ureido-D-serine cyclo-ligase
MSDMISRRRTSDQPVQLRIALVTAEAARELDEDMPPLTAALRSAGAEVAAPAWDDPGADWSGFDLALLRSTWDYADRREEFLAWCDRCATLTRLLNPPPVLRWNTDKHYLLDLDRAGVPVVPVRFVEPRDDGQRALEDFLGGTAAGLSAGRAGAFDEFVVKPAIGAGSRDAARYGRAEAAAASDHVRRLLGAGRSVLLQPYLERVEHAGETALLYFGDEYSHAIRKGPLLRRGAPLVDGLFAPEDICPREPTAAERAVAAAACAAIPFDPPVYARVDLLQDESGAPVVLELELTEPSLFLAHAPGAAQRCAVHVLRAAAATR